ncbi:hypothetical protein GW17_00001033 [Ensete ventricosum]|nr:hypothetical protein GW17_00001033 [Ensete ventricosum]
MWGRINVGKKDLWVPPFTFYFLPGKTPPPPAHGRHIRPVELRHLSRVDWLLSLLSPTTTRASLLVILFPPPRTVGYPSSAFPNRESHLGSRARAAGAGGGPRSHLPALDTLALVLEPPAKKHVCVHWAPCARDSGQFTRRLKPLTGRGTPHGPTTTLPHACLLSHWWVCGVHYSDKRVELREGR